MSITSWNLSITDGPLVKRNVILAITYYIGEKCADQVITIHPYYLHQQRAHWNLLGYDATNEAPTVLPLASIMSLSTAYGIEFIPNDELPLQDFYNKNEMNV